MKIVLILSMAVVTELAAGPQQRVDAQPDDDPIIQQRKAVQAMAEALAAQRASIAKQTGQKTSETFFLLEPPSASPVAIPAAKPPEPVVPPARTVGGDCEPMSTSEIDSLLETAAKREDLQVELLRGVVRQESGFRPCAVSPKGAMGLMQLMPGTATQFGVKDPFNAKENVDAGAKFLKQLLNLYNDLPMALGAYNAGPGRVNEVGGVPQIPETLNYIQRILSLLPIKP